MLILDLKPKEKELIMKKRIFLSCVLITLALSLLSCSYSGDGGTDYASTIVSLEAKFDELKRAQDEATMKNQASISELQAIISAMAQDKDKAPSDNSDTQNKDEQSATVAVGFTYTQSDGCATITGYSGQDTDIVIPASINGLRVTAIADSAFSNTQIKSVIISDGIEKIGWFAFNGCTRLTSVTIPSSVTSIGYSALGSAPSPLTVYCHSTSFALSYAKSYGLTYVVI